MGDRHECRRFPIAIVAAAAVTVGGAALSASAQTAAGSRGHALDANPQQGSGGVNRGEAINYRDRNNIVTGNVTDFRHFRGDVGYSAPGDFGEDLGSDDIFRFRADSFSSGRTQLSATNINRNASNLSYSVYSTVSQVPGFEFRQSPLQSQNLAPEGGGFQVYNPVFRPSSATGIITEPIVGDVRDTGTSLGVIEVPDGRTLEVTASPLLGLRRFELNEFGTTAFTEEQARADEAARLEAQLQDEFDLAPLSRLETRVGDVQVDEEIAEALGPLARRAGRVEPTLLLGRVIQARLALDRADVPADETLDQRVERLERSIFRPLGNRNVEPGQDVYLDLLRQLRERETPQRRDRPGPSSRLTDPDAERADADGGDGGDGGEEDEDRPGFDPSRLEPLQGDLEGALEEPTPDEVRSAERRAREARRARFGPGEGAGDGEGRPTPDELRRSGDPVSAILERIRRGEVAGDAEDGGGPTALEQMLDTISRDTAPVASLAGERETRLNALLRQAEAELAGGRYFVAEGIYRQVVEGSPEDRPLARVGLVHAQLAAGMIRSAGRNLRQLFASHPELIGVRYESNLLPPRERLSFLQDELQRSINREVAGADPGLLLAYLGFQAGSERLVRYGLSVAEAQAPRDPLLPVVRGVWLRRLDAAAGSDAEPAAEVDPAKLGGGRDASPVGGAAPSAADPEPAGK